MVAALTDYKSNVTSQSGEDGLIAEILRRIGTESRFCVEFGAWDGKHLSNTWSLWHDQGWSAVLIEGDPSKAADLEASLADYPAVTAHCAFVAASGENTLDAILQRLGAPRVVDVLSIDIDGDDYQVFDSVESFPARVVVIEYNPTIPPHLELIGTPGSYFGSSARSLYKLAQAKGYALAACTTTNLIFVRRADFHKLGITEPRLEDVMPLDNLTYVITAYDGATFLSRQPTYKNSMSTSLRETLSASRAKSRRLAELRRRLTSILAVSIRRGR